MYDVCNMFTFKVRCRKHKTMFNYSIQNRDSKAAISFFFLNRGFRVVYCLFGEELPLYHSGPMKHFFKPSFDSTPTFSLNSYEYRNPLRFSLFFLKRGVDYEPTR